MQVHPSTQEAYEVNRKPKKRSKKYKWPNRGNNHHIAHNGLVTLKD